MARAEIVATGFYVPDEILTNRFFTESPFNPYKVYIGQDENNSPLYRKERVQLTEEKIATNTGGIKERRRIAQGQDAVDLVCEAFKTTGFDASRLEGIVIGNVSDPTRYPSLACRVQKRIGAKNVSYAEDVSAACSGATHALDLARLQVQENKGYWLAGGVEVLTRIIDYEEVNCDLFGDGCGLFIVGPTNDATRGILKTKFRSDISGIEFIYQDSLGKLRMPHGPKVFLKAVRGMIDIAHELTAEAEIPETEVDFYIAHQANGRIVNKIEEVVDPQKSGKVIRTIGRYGNMSAATVPVALAEAMHKGTIKKGDLVTLIDMGSGLAFGGALIRI
ncbi:MAG: ketoacyl-ACP synthase III [Nanoarchaeota archaeon]